MGHGSDFADAGEGDIVLLGIGEHEFGSPVRGEEVAEVDFRERLLVELDGVGTEVGGEGGERAGMVERGHLQDAQADQPGGFHLLGLGDGERREGQN